MGYGLSALSTTVEITIGYLTEVITFTDLESTTVEITIGYLTTNTYVKEIRSTTVEITIGYLTKGVCRQITLSTTVEITIGYLTNIWGDTSLYIYNSRNYYRLLNSLNLFIL